jgi:hypothetical protein
MTGGVITDAALILLALWMFLGDPSGAHRLNTIINFHYGQIQGEISWQHDAEERKRYRPKQD